MKRQKSTKAQKHKKQLTNILTNIYFVIIIIVNDNTRRKTFIR